MRSGNGTEMNTEKELTRTDISRLPKFGENATFFDYSCSAIVSLGDSAHLAFRR